MQDDSSDEPNRTERRPSRRGVVVGAGALGVLAVGGGGYALVKALDHEGSGDGKGGGILGGDDDEPTAPPRIATSLKDQSAHVPEAAVTDLSKLSQPVKASYPRLPKARGLSEAIDVAANKMLREHVFAGDDAGQLTITGTVFAAGADVLAASLLHKDARGDSPAVIYYRADGDRAFTSPGLIDETTWAQLEKAVATAAKDLDGVDAASLASALQEQPRPWGNGPAIIPEGDGTLHVVFPAASVSGSRKEADVVLKPAVAAPLLSDDGKAVIAALKTPADFDPSKVTIPGDGSTKGDKCYVQPEQVWEPAAPRQGDGVGPVSQLAPLSGAGVRPSTVAAPDAARLKAMALTFDDGPAPELNQKLRDTLNEHKVAATFFMIGQSVKAAPEWCTKTAVNGFEIGSHSWSHKQLSALSGQKLTDEVVKPTDVINEAMGRPPFIMRPPYGARNDGVDAAVGQLGQSSQIWDVDTLDWKTLNVDKNIAAVQTSTVRGSIVLMHEIHPTSVQSVPAILDWLRDNDWTILTCSEIGQNQMRAGKHYMQGLVTHDIQPAQPTTGGASDGGH